MQFRYARHTNDIANIERFYTEVIGLEKLGGFNDHEFYDGVFLGYKNADWHLEFTTSNNLPTRNFDDDDILVFYINAEIELEQIKKKILKKGISLELPKNPFWKDHSIMISDPDGHKIVVSIKHQNLNSKDQLTGLVLEKGIETWSELITFVQKLPYGRNANRDDFSLLLKDMRGTCSSKHGFLKKIADLNEIENVQLIIGIYRMNKLNTPKIGDIISEKGLDFIPEAHCYLKLNNQRIDVTHINSDIDKLTNDILCEIEIKPEQVADFKVDYHQKYLKKWIIENSIALSFDEIWNLREQCIRNLSS